MREKYIEERFPRWFDLNDAGHGAQTIIELAYSGGADQVTMSRATAERLINARDAFVDEVVAALMEDESAADAVIGAGASPKT